MRGAFFYGLVAIKVTNKVAKRIRICTKCRYILKECRISKLVDMLLHRDNSLRALLIQIGSNLARFFAKYSCKFYFGVLNSLSAVRLICKS